jgi:uncharacterized protein (TIGR02597 family)
MMKTPTKFIALLSGAALLASSAFAQGVATNPVGYVTMDIVADGYTFIGTPLVNASTFSGAAVSVSTSDVTFAASSFAAGAFNQVVIGADNVSQYVFEVTSGTDVGVMIPIVSNTTDTLTLAEDVSAYVAAATTGIVRALHTLDSLFPDAAPLASGFSAAAADSVLVFDSDTQTSKSYFYSSLANEWRAGSTANGQRSILPNQAIYINRKGDATKVTFTGTVKTGTTAIDIFPGYNLIPNPYPVAYSFDLSSLYTGDPATGLAAGFSAAAADVVIVYGADASATTYFYSSLADEWRTGSTSAGSVQIPVGGALMINRKAAEGAFSWVKTQPFSLDPEPSI